MENKYGIEEIQSLDFRTGVRSFCVYKHTLKADGRVYIGQTNSIKNRWKPSAYKNCIYFYNCILKYGWENFEHEIILDNLTIEEANKEEERLIKEYDSTNKEKGFNLKSGGLNNLHSEETKKKMSKTRKGVQKTNEHKKAISEGLKKYFTNSEGEKECPKEIRQRLLEYNKKRSKKVQCIETEIIYESLSEAEKETGILGETISRNCRGKQKSASGYHWRFIENEE